MFQQIIAHNTSIFIIIVLNVVALTKATNDHQQLHVHPMESKNFSIYQQHHNKIYLRPHEENRGWKAFEQNRIEITEHNKRFEKGEETFRLGTNFFSDMDQRTYLNSQLRLTESKRDIERVVERRSINSVLQEQIPAYMDWRKEGFRTALQNQDDCGSCYAFSIAGSIEGQFFKRTGQLLKLSSQQIIDCSDSYGNHGCIGGSLRNTLKYLGDTGGIMTANHYPYISKKGKCHFLKELSVINVTSWQLLPFKDEQSIKEAVALIGPVAISINAAPRTFQLYRDGIYQDKACTSDVNHAMLIVGYGPGYWILKNWWGDLWGEAGYMRIKKGVNMCGIANYAAYVKL